MNTLTVADYEEVELKTPRQRLFADCTESAMSAAPSYQQQFLPDAAFWSRRIGVALVPSENKRMRLVKLI